VLEPCLKVTAAGLDHGAWLVAVSGKPFNGLRREVIEDGVTVLTGWPDIDVRAPRIVGLEERNPGKNGLDGAIRQAGEHSPLAQDTEVVGRCVESAEHPFDSVSGSIHTASFSADLLKAGNWC
jgi:hypothetical protein